MKTRIQFQTLGCRLNQSETAVIEQSFSHADYQLVAEKDVADIAIINTCTVTENGDADTRRLVNKAVRTNPDVRIALVGCQAQIQKDKLAELPNVKWVVGNERKMDIRNIIEQYADDPQTQVITPTIQKKNFTIPSAAIDLNRTRANIKIQDGCDFFCSFCEIPYARGRARSREFNNIIEECLTLAKAGYQEIVITGINVGTYQFKSKGLLNIIDEMEKIEGLKRIRISSIEPTTIDFRLIERMADPQSKLCRYLHIPLQSGHDDVLTDMKRKYSLAEFDHFICTAKERVAEICIGTDVIVGFPTETDQHFEKTEEYLRNAPIDYFHVFSYSKRHIAKSQHIDKANHQYVIKERSRILRELSQRKRSAYFGTLLDTEQQVLFEQQQDGIWSGLTDHYVRVFVSSESNLANQFLKVQINKLENQKIYGSLKA